MNNKNQEVVKIVVGVLIIAMGVSIFQSSLNRKTKVDPQAEQIKALETQVMDLEDRVEELENLVIEVNKELENSQSVTESPSESQKSEVNPENELSNDINKGYSIVKKSIKDFVGKLGQ